MCHAIARSTMSKHGNIFKLCLLNYAQHFSKGNSFAEKKPEISEVQKFKFKE